jgi:hypothetical protein
VTVITVFNHARAGYLPTESIVMGAIAVGKFINASSIQLAAWHHRGRHGTRSIDQGGGTGRSLLADLQAKLLNTKKGWTARRCHLLA